MFETPEETAELQELLDRSHAGSTEHLRGIIGPKALCAPWTSWR